MAPLLHRAAIKKPTPCITVTHHAPARLLFPVQSVKQHHTEDMPIYTTALCANGTSLTAVIDTTTGPTIKQTQRLKAKYHYAIQLGYSAR